MTLKMVSNQSIHSCSSLHSSVDLPSWKEGVRSLFKIAHSRNLSWMYLPVKLATITVWYSQGFFFVLFWLQKTLFQFFNSFTCLKNVTLVQMHSLVPFVQNDWWRWGELLKYVQHAVSLEVSETVNMLCSWLRPGADITDVTRCLGAEREIKFSSHIPVKTLGLGEYPRSCVRCRDVIESARFQVYRCARMQCLMPLNRPAAPRRSAEGQTEVMLRQPCKVRAPQLL